MKIVATKPIAPRPVAAKAQPLRWARVSTAARISAIAVSAAGTAVGRMPRLLRSWATTTVQATIAMPRIAAGSDSRLAIAAARSQKSPDIRSVRYVAPWAAKMATTASPATTV